MVWLAWRCLCRPVSDQRIYTRPQVITFVTSEGLVNLSDSRGLFQGFVVGCTCLDSDYV